jgi:hypothetical protein
LQIRQRTVPEAGLEIANEPWWVAAGAPAAVTIDTRIAKTVKTVNETLWRISNPPNGRKKLLSV